MKEDNNTSSDKITTGQANIQQVIMSCKMVNHSLDSCSLLLQTLANLMQYTPELQKKSKAR